MSCTGISPTTCASHRGTANRQQNDAATDLADGVKGVGGALLVALLRLFLRFVDRLHEPYEEHNDSGNENSRRATSTVLYCNNGSERKRYSGELVGIGDEALLHGRLHRAHEVAQHVLHVRHGLQKRNKEERNRNLRGEKNNDDDKINRSKG